MLVEIVIVWMVAFWVVDFIAALRRGIEDEEIMGVT